MEVIHRQSKVQDQSIPSEGQDRHSGVHPHVIQMEAHQAHSWAIKSIPHITYMWKYVGTNVRCSKQSIQAMSVLKTSLIHASNMLQKYLSNPRDVASFFCWRRHFTTDTADLLRAKYCGHQPMATPLPKTLTSPVLPLSVDLRPGVQLRKLAAPLGKKHPLYDLATRQQMTEQLIIHQLVLALWLTSHAFSGHVRVHNTQEEKEKTTVMFQAMVGFWNGNVQIWWW